MWCVCSGWSVALESIRKTRNIRDDVDVRAVSVAVVFAATARRGSLAGTAHLPAFHHVAHALEVAVVLTLLLFHMQDSSGLVHDSVRNFEVGTSGSLKLKL